MSEFVFNPDDVKVTLDALAVADAEQVAREDEVAAMIPAELRTHHG